MSSPWGTTRSHAARRAGGRAARAVVERPKRPRLPMRRRRIRRAPGRCPGAPLSKPKWCGTTDECRAITRVSSSRICAKRRSRIYTHCIAPAATVRIAVKELKHALAFGRTSCIALLGQSVARHLDGGRVRPLPRTATPCGPDRAPRGASPSAAAGADHDRGAGRAVGPPDRPAFPAIRIQTLT